jgi:anti-sigma-K factor RskA
MSGNMSTTDHSTGDDGRLLAAEYVLGVLSAEERRAVERRLPHDAALAREIESWEERPGGLADAVAPVAPPAQAWPRIEAAVAAQPAARSTSLWDSLVFWRNFGIGTATLAAASIAALAYVGITLAPQRAPLFATLGQKSGQPGFVAAISADGASMTIVPAALLASNKNSYELWLIPPGGKPRSLGLVAVGKPVRITVPHDLLDYVHSGATLAVSEEPLGGSPTGQPTGPVVAHGDLTNL